MSLNSKILAIFLSAAILTAVQSLQVHQLKAKRKEIAYCIEKIQVEKGYLQPEELFSEDIEPVINKATCQKDLAKGIFDVVQLEEGRKCADLPPERYSASFALYYFNSSPYKREFTDTIDGIEKKWVSLPADDYYGEVGLFLLYANIETGRFPQAEGVFEKLVQNCKGEGIDPQFETYSLMKAIESRAALQKEFWRPREDLTLLYAASLTEHMYMLQGKPDKVAETLAVILNNYAGSKAAQFMKAAYEFEQADLKYGTSQEVSKEKREQLFNRLQTARKELEDFMKKKAY
jgi:hypothetical protein